MTATIDYIPDLIAGDFLTLIEGKFTPCSIKFRGALSGQHLEIAHGAFIPDPLYVVQSCTRTATNVTFEYYELGKRNGNRTSEPR